MGASLGAPHVVMTDYSHGARHGVAVEAWCYRRFHFKHGVAGMRSAHIHVVLDASMVSQVCAVLTSTPLLM